MRFEKILDGRRVILPRAGMLLAGVLLGGCVPSAEHEQALKMAASAQGELEAMRRDGAKEVENLKAELESERSRAKDVNQALEVEVERLREESERASKALEELKAEFEAYKKAYRVSLRENASGLSIDELRTLTGKVYRGIKVRTLDARMVSFIHESGSGSIELYNLAPEFHPLLGYDPRDADEQGAGDKGGRIVRAAGDVENITGSWDQLKKEAALENGKVEAQIAANAKKRDAIVEQMKLLNSEIVRLDNEIVRAGAGGGNLRQRKRQLEGQYTKLGADLARLD